MTKTELKAKLAKLRELHQSAGQVQEQGDEPWAKSFEVEADLLAAQIVGAFFPPAALRFKPGDRVVWNGPDRDERPDKRGERGTGEVTHATWENGGYVRWQDGAEEPCLWGNLKGATQ